MRLRLLYSQVQAALAANARGGAATALPITPLSTGMPPAVVGAQPPASGAPAAAQAAAQARAFFPDTLQGQKWVADLLALFYGCCVCSWPQASPAHSMARLRGTLASGCKGERVGWTHSAWLPTHALLQHFFYMAPALQAPIRNARAGGCAGK